MGYLCVLYVFFVVFKTLYGKHTNPELPSFKGLRIRLANQQAWICTTHDNLVPIISDAYLHRFELSCSVFSCRFRK
nr:MAG TPA_asm: hypothetical protein [Caudoviricetes sp.]